MTADEETAALFLPPTPIIDRRGKPVPEPIGCLLGLLRILLTYGQHLSATLEHRAARRSFSVIAQYFGACWLPAILVRVARGLRRVAALERVLLERAAHGRPLIRYPDPGWMQRLQRKPAGKRKPRPGRAPRPDPNATLTFETLPSVEDLMAEIRRQRWIGKALIAICFDLGIGPGVCEGSFGSALFQAITWYRGRFPKYYKEMLRRERVWCDALDRNHQLNTRYARPEPTRTGIRQALGFFVGEPPVEPDPPAMPLDPLVDSPDPPIPRPG